MENNSLGRVVAVLTSPAKTFASIAERPTWLVPMLLLVVLGLASTLLSAPKIDWDASIRAQLEQSSAQLSDDQIADQIEIVEKFSKVAMLVVAGVVPWIFYPLVALIFLGLLKVVGGEVGFKTSLGVLLYGYIPWVLATLLSLPVVASRDQLTTEELQDGLLMSNLAAFASPDTNPVLRSLLGSIDVFSAWTLILLTIGYAVAAKVSKGRAAICIVGLWAVWVAGKVGLTAVGQAFGG